MADFQKIRDAVSIDDVATGYLRLKLTESNGVLRGSCPRCGGDRTLSIQTAMTSGKRYFNCHVTKEAWGDAIALVAHCHNISKHEAGIALAKVYLDGEAPEPEPKAEASSFDPLKFISTLKSDAEDVKQFGISAELCKEVGSMGLQTTGMHRTRLAIPLRREDGSFIEWASTDNLKVTKKWRVAP